MANFHIKKDDTAPAIEAQLKDANGDPVDLTGGSVKFLMGTGPNVTSQKVSAPAVITDAENGKVKYEWASGDTDTVGVFYAEWEVTYSDGTVETFPADTYTTVEVEEDIG